MSQGRGAAAAALLVLASSGCIGAGPDPRPRVEALIEAPPPAWADALPPVLAAGRRTAPALAQALRARPGAPGARAVAFALGELGAVEALEVLAEHVAGRGPAAQEAALALGKIGEPRAATTLRPVVADVTADLSLRTAAAAALLDLGEVAAAAPLLRAVLVGGTPRGRALAAEHGIDPDRQRWALERWLAIEAIRRHTGGEDFGLHPDAPWPSLARGADAFWEHALRDAPALAERQG